MSNQCCALKRELSMCTEIHSSTNSSGQPGDGIATEVDVLLQIVTQHLPSQSLNLPFPLPASEVTSWVYPHSIAYMMRCMMKFQLDKNTSAVFLILILFILLCFAIHIKATYTWWRLKNITVHSLQIKMTFSPPSLGRKKHVGDPAFPPLLEVESQGSPKTRRQHRAAHQPVGGSRGGQRLPLTYIDFLGPALTSSASWLPVFEWHLLFWGGRSRVMLWGLQRENLKS